MALQATAFFDESLGYYRARFWRNDPPYNTARKIPEKYWLGLGIEKPTTDKRHAKLAQSWAEREAIEIEKLLNSAPQRAKKTVAEVWEIYKRDNPDKVSAATILRNDINAKNVIAFLTESRLDDITPEQLDIVLATRYRNWREKQEVSPRTVWNELSFMKQLATFALAWQSETGCESLRLIKLPYVELPDNDGVALTEDEFGRVLEKVKPRDVEILAAGVTTRLRKNNLLGLRGEWFDPSEKWLHIDKALMKGTRGKKRNLSVPVPEWTLSIVGERTEGFLWTNDRTGGPMRHYEHILEEAIGKAGVRPFTLHDLRTTGNSWLDRAGVDKMTRRVLMGHSTKSGDVTDLYTKKFVEQLRESVDVYDQIRRRNGW